MGRAAPQIQVFFTFDFCWVLRQTMDHTNLYFCMCVTVCVYTTALRGKDKAAPNDSPRAKKKVISAPAVSASFDSTNLVREQQLKPGQLWNI